MLNEYGVTVGGGEKSMEMYGGDSCTTMGMYLVPLNYTLKNSKFYVIFILPQFKKSTDHIC